MIGGILYLLPGREPEFNSGLVGSGGASFMRPYFFSSLSVKNCVGPPVSLLPQKLPVMVSSDSSGTSSGPLAKAGKAKMAQTAIEQTNLFNKTNYLELSACPVGFVRRTESRY